MALQHKSASFDFEGSVTVETLHHGSNSCRVTLNGVPYPSGCEDGAIGDLFGIENIIRAAETDIVLNEIGVSEIEEYLMGLDESDVQRVYDALGETLADCKIEGES